MLSLFLSKPRTRTRKEREERVCPVRRRLRQRPNAFGKEKGPLSLSLSKESAFCCGRVPRMTNFERTGLRVYYLGFRREKNEKKEKKQPHAFRVLKERIKYWWWSRRARVSINRQIVSRARKMNVLKF